MNNKYIEFTGSISSATFLEREAFLVIESEDGERRLFQALGRTLGIELNNESDIERHRRYDLGMDTNMVFIINNFSQCIVSYRWKIMRQISELTRYVIDKARVSDYEDGCQIAVVWMKKLQDSVSFPITEDVISEVHKSLEIHPNIESVERNGGWFTIVARF